MTIKATAFKFTSVKIKPQERRLIFNYEIKFISGKAEKFSEEIIFPASCDFNNIPKKLLNNFIADLHLALGIGYYKLYAPKRFEYNYELSKDQADFFNHLYRKGLGEFCFRNKLKFKDLAVFKASLKTSRPVFDLSPADSCLVGVGGGKDSIVAIELLKREKMPLKGFLIETEKEAPISREVIKLAAIPSLIIKRKLDPKIFQSWPNSYNGHIPISAIFAFLGALTAALTGQKYFAVANEYSSNFGNIKYDGEEINHQWSKSAEFEEMFQTYLEKNLSPDLKYFSPIRPYYEIRVTEMFSKMEKYFPVFTSCNCSFRVHLDRPEGKWCGECPKCAFMFAMLAAFLPKEKVIAIFGRNLLEDKKLLPLFMDLLGLGKMKPFDCVGTFEEMQVAFNLLKGKFSSSYIVKELVGKIKTDKRKEKDLFKYYLAPNVPERFRFFGVKKVLILGYDREGKANERFLKRYYPEIEIGIADKFQGDNYLEVQDDYDLGIKTPGLPANLLTMPYTTGTNIFLSRIKNKVIGVTGSKGKSTTASLIYEILKAAKMKVRLLGNIGEPMLDYLLNKPDDKEVLVLELSSYQLADINFSPHIAVITNLFPEHLDYHNGLENYYSAKKNILGHQGRGDYFIFNPKIAELKKWSKSSKAKAIALKNDFKFKLSDSPLIGNHNLDNIISAASVARIFKINDKTIRRALKGFRPLPHRLQFIGEYKGIKFYDDAISTTPESTMMALSALKKVGTIFLGGTDRGYDFSKLERMIRKLKIKNLVLFPESGLKMFKTRNGLNVLETESMEEAVAFAYKYTPRGYIVLLSNASPSYSLWKNFEVKGEEFKKFVIKHSK